MKLRIGIALALALGLAVSTTPPAADAGQPAAAVAKKKRCKKGKVRMKVGKKTRCVKLGKAFPKPKSIDVADGHARDDRPRQELRVVARHAPEHLHLRRRERRPDVQRRIARPGAAERQRAAPGADGARAAGVR